MNTGCTSNNDRSRTFGASCILVAPPTMTGRSRTFDASVAPATITGPGMSHCAGVTDAITAGSVYTIQYPTPETMQRKLVRISCTAK